MRALGAQLQGKERNQRVVLNVQYRFSCGRAGVVQVGAAGFLFSGFGGGVVCVRAFPLIFLWGRLRRASSRWPRQLGVAPSSDKSSHCSGFMLGSRAGHHAALSLSASQEPETVTFSEGEASATILARGPGVGFQP